MKKNEEYENEEERKGWKAPKKKKQWRRETRKLEEKTESLNTEVQDNKTINRWSKRQTSWIKKRKKNVFGEKPKTLVDGLVHCNTISVMSHPPALEGWIHLITKPVSNIFYNVLWSSLRKNFHLSSNYIKVHNEMGCSILLKMLKMLQRTLFDKL